MINNRTESLINAKRLARLIMIFWCNTALEFMNDPKMLSADKCLLLVVDIQDAFLNHIEQMDQVIKRSRIMIEAAKLLDLPLIATEQYPQALGRTVKVLRDALGDIRYYDKVCFSCCGDETIKKAIIDSSRSQILMVGIETHVCVLQTAFNLLEMDKQVFIASDAVSSRRQNDTEIALHRLQQQGVIITTTETAIMEMTASSKHPAFREISRLIK